LNDTDAAREAGYSEQSALSGKPMQSNAVQVAFLQLMEEACPDQLLVKKIREGLDAMETKIATFEGTISDSKDFISWSERRAYLELALKARRLITREPVEAGGMVNLIADL